MKKLFFLVFICAGCSMLFSPDKYNPNPTVKPVVEEKIDTVKTDTVRTIIIID